MGVGHASVAYKLLGLTVSFLAQVGGLNLSLKTPDLMPNGPCKNADSAAGKESLNRCETNCRQEGVHKESLLLCTARAARRQTCGEHMSRTT